jgi:aflatoxin B1 aldehyde reductase
LDGKKGDCVILGASSVGHLEANLAAAEKAAVGEALPECVLEAIEAAFEVCKPVAPPYSRGHSKIA